MASNEETPSTNPPQPSQEDQTNLLAEGSANGPAKPEHQVNPPDTPSPEPPLTKLVHHPAQADKAVQTNMYPNPYAEESDTCDICREVLSDKTTLHPCGHEFDLHCILQWNGGAQDDAEKCPMCRRPVIQFRTEMGDGSVKVENAQARRQLDREAERLRIEATMEIERLRLDALPERYARGYTRYVDASVVIGEWVVTIIKEYELYVRQSGTRTKSVLLLGTEVSCRSPDLSEKLNEPTPEILEVVRKDMDAMERRTGQWVGKDVYDEGNFEKLSLELRSNEVEDGQRHIHSVLEGEFICDNPGSFIPHRLLAVTRPGWFSSSWSVRKVLVEEGPAYNGPRVADRTQWNLSSADQNTSEYVQAAQGLMKWFKDHMIWSGDDLDRGSTNLVERFGAHEIWCAHCGTSDHLNQSCRLPSKDRWKECV